MHQNLKSFSSINNINISIDFHLSKNKVQLSFLIKGALNEYIFPEKSKQKRADELWKATSFELFLANSKKEEYYELNFTSSLAWNFYYLNSYRADVKEVKIISKPQIEVFSSNDKFKIVFELEVKNLVEFDVCNVACIVLNKNNERTFWSINHLLDVADFHERRNFLEIS